MANTQYATAQQLRQLIGKTSTADDSDLWRVLNAAATAIDNHCNRKKPSNNRDFFVADSTATACVYRGTGKYYQQIDACTEITTVAVKDAATDSTYTAWASTDWQAASGDVRYPDFNRLPYELLLITANGDYSHFTSGEWTGLKGFPPDAPGKWGVPTVQVTAKWGYAATVPDAIAMACQMQAARWYKRLQGGMADALATGELGQLVYLKKLDPDIAELLEEGRYVRPMI